jgi:hypothetical protein
MANPEHLAILDKGVEFWNKWRQGNNERVASSNPLDKVVLKILSDKIDLSNSDLSGKTLSNINFADVDLSGASLINTELNNADLSNANLSETILSGAKLIKAKIINTNLNKAIFIKNIGTYSFLAKLSGSNILSKHNNIPFSNSDTDLSGADLSGANLTNIKLSLIDRNEAILISLLTYLSLSALFIRSLSKASDKSILFIPIIIASIYIFMFLTLTLTFFIAIKSMGKRPNLSHLIKVILPMSHASIKNIFKQAFTRVLIMKNVRLGGCTLDKNTLKELLWSKGCKIGINGISLLSGYKSNKFNWLQILTS